MNRPAPRPGSSRTSRLAVLVAVGIIVLFFAGLLYVATDLLPYDHFLTCLHDPGYETCSDTPGPRG